MQRTRAIVLVAVLAVAGSVAGCTPSSSSSSSSPALSSVSPSAASVTIYSAPTHSLAIPDALGLSRSGGLTGPLGLKSGFFGAHGEELVVEYFGSAGGDVALARLIAQAKDPRTSAVLVAEAPLTLPAGKAQRMEFTLQGHRVVIYAIAAPTTSAVIVATGISDDAAVDAIVRSFRFAPAP